MIDSELKRLYALYKAGEKNDNGQPSDLLQVARFTGYDLEEEEFAWLSDRVQEAYTEHGDNRHRAEHGDGTDEYLETAAKLTERLNKLPAMLRARKKAIKQSQAENPQRSPDASPGPASQVMQDILASVSPVPTIQAGLNKDGDNQQAPQAPPVQTGLNQSDSDESGSPASSSSSQSPMGGFLDKLLMGLDVAGTFEPTPFADLTNAAISTGRAFTDPSKAGTHLKNAGLSLISTLPYLGDISKLAKGYGASGKTVGNTIQSFAGGRLGELAGGLLGGSGGGGSGGGNGSEASPSSDGGELPESLAKLSTTFGNLAIVGGSLYAAFRLMNTWVNSTVEAGKRLTEQNRFLANYSGELSNAMAAYDTGKVLRDVRKAEYLGESASGLAASQTQLEDAVAYRDEPLERFGNDFSTVMNQIATMAVYAQSFIDFRVVLLRAIYSVRDAATENSKAGDPRDAAEAFFQKLDRDRERENKPPEEAKKPDPPRLAADKAAERNQRQINRLNIR